MMMTEMILITIITGLSSISVAALFAIGFHKRLVSESTRAKMEVRLTQLLEDVESRVQECERTTEDSVSKLTNSVNALEMMKNIDTRDY